MVEVSSLTEKAKIEITPLSQKVLDNLDVLSKLLTNYEDIVLKILVLHGALSTKEIRRWYGYVLAEKVLKKEITDFSIKEFNILENELKKKKGAGIPAFETFENILLSLEKLGLVGRRYDPLKKAKWLWIVNPSYLAALKDKNKVDIDKHIDRLKKLTKN